MVTKEIAVRARALDDQKEVYICVTQSRLLQRNDERQNRQQRAQNETKQKNTPLEKFLLAFSACVFCFLQKKKEKKTSVPLSMVLRDDDVGRRFGDFVEKKKHTHRHRRWHAKWNWLQKTNKQRETPPWPRPLHLFFIFRFASIGGTVVRFYRIIIIIWFLQISL